MKTQRKIAAKTADGRIIAIEDDVPELKAGAVLVDVKASLVSPGTELGGWRSLKAKRENPAEGDPKPFGYSNAGVVREVGEGVREFKPGDRVACIGGGYAAHTDVAVVPHHLCVALPEAVACSQGAYAMLMATGLHAVRRAEPQLGEWVAVAGMGILGHLTGQFFRLAGCAVIGWDSIPQRLDIAHGWGIDATCNITEQDPVETTKAFTGGFGLDAAMVAFGGDGNPAVQAIHQSLKRTPDGHSMGRIVVVGNPSFDWPMRAGSNAEIRQAGRTGAGYHDEAWEFGPAYPSVYMRWTTRTNLDLCMRLVAEGRLDVDCLTTHKIPLADVEAGIDAIIDKPDDILGVVFEM